MAESDLFCLPTRIEPFGIVVIEAMAARTPVLVPRSGAFTDFIDESRNGFFHEPNDVDSLTKAMVNAFQQRDRFAEIGDNARATVVPDYTWQHVARRMLALIRDPARSSAAAWSDGYCASQAAAYCAREGATPPAPLRSDGALGGRPSRPA